MTRNDYMMMLYDLCNEIYDFGQDPTDDAFKDLQDRAVNYKIAIDLELDEQEAEADCDDSNDGEALASAGMGTDEDYGGTDERI
jgi:hypothetical protein